MSQKPDNEHPQSAAAVPSPTRPAEPATRDDVPAGPSTAPVRTDAEAGVMWIPL